MARCPVCKATQKVVDSRSEDTENSRLWSRASKLAEGLISKGVVPPILVARARRCKNGHTEVTIEVSLGVAS